jgi:hypothetical protein
MADEQPTYTRLDAFAPGGRVGKATTESVHVQQKTPPPLPVMRPLPVNPVKAKTEVLRISDMNEMLTFPESKIPQVVALIRRGLEQETDPKLKRQFERQCDELEAYYKRLQEE